MRTDASLLLAAVELHNKEAAGEVTRLQGLALMLRNSALALMFALVVAVIELVVGTDHLLFLLPPPPELRYFPPGQDGGRAEYSV